ncbi:UDP-N-acetylglucosamine transferase subunit ALG14 homolog [Scaptodrosophila lebanonensis]|uniref:UDP-N-acetylglucosamine transferase subunit ALG14 n=1 Tax=Drosophila lebanonensis TaxID=7225 RepID=A0A6J2TRI4_DROLE|nr:UDP-N-acetylglucosamine transferase subunit ALG14 homolog [Scaptodrosophila lebanonensis]
MDAAGPTYVVLGSGGHTAEMCRINEALRLANHNDGAFAQVRYIVAQSDTTSQSQMCKVVPSAQDRDFIRVPRSREVGQSWLSSIFTTLWALLWSFWLVWRDRPQLLLCNGPGTCVPYCYVAFLLRLLGRLPATTKIVFVESYCRVKTLSLSGRLLLPLADMFVVQWPALATRYEHKKNLRYFGRLL